MGGRSNRRLPERKLFVPLRFRRRNPPKSSSPSRMPVWRSCSSGPSVRRTVCPRKARWRSASERHAFFPWRQSLRHNRKRYGSQVASTVPQRKAARHWILLQKRGAPRANGALRPHEGGRGGEVRGFRPIPATSGFSAGVSLCGGGGRSSEKNAADLAPAGAFLLFLAPQQVVGPFHMNVEPHVGQRFGDEPAHGGGRGRARERVALGQAERRVDVAFGRNPACARAAPGRCAGSGRARSPRREAARAPARARATSILEVAEPHRYTGAGTLAVSGVFPVWETGAVKNCSRYGQAVLVPGMVNAASGSPFQRAEPAA